MSAVFSRGRLGCAAVALWCAAGMAAAREGGAWHFGRAGAEGIAVEKPVLFSAAAGYGFEPGNTPEIRAGAAVSDKPFLFSVALPEGRHRVRVTLGDPLGAADTTVKAETRRLALEEVKTEAGGETVREFTVHVRRPEIDGGGVVKLKDRERRTFAWDDKLTLEFNGPRPALSQLSITPDPDGATVYLLGDSTVTDQAAEPWASWGQMLPRFFQAGVAVANFAESGESLRSSLAARRVAKVESLLRGGDFVLVQFGHNDMKDGRDGAEELFQRNLADLVRRVRAKGATPVLVTSMERQAGVKGNTLGNYPDIVRAVAAAEKTALIDLNAMSKTLYAALGERMGLAFQDGSHHNNYGAMQLARCVVEGVRSAGLPELAAAIAVDCAPFDPAAPADPASFHFPASPRRSAEKPEGD